jgi:hypothetical protein
VTPAENTAIEQLPEGQFASPCRTTCFVCGEPIATEELHWCVPGRGDAHNDCWSEEKP